MHFPFFWFYFFFSKKAPAEAEGSRNNRFNNRRISSIFFLSRKMMAWSVTGSAAVSDIRATDPFLYSNRIVSPRLSLF